MNGKLTQLSTSKLTNVDMTILGNLVQTLASSDLQNIIYTFVASSYKAYSEILQKTDFKI